MKNLFGDISLMAIERLKHFEPPDGYYVAFSGGKDSIVLLDLVKRSGVKYDVHFNLTSVDPPELVKFIKDNYPEVEIHKPEKSMFQLIVEHKMLPIRNIKFCCEFLKERGGTGRTVVTGIRWAESTRRSKRGLYEVCRTDGTKRFVHPIIDWKDDEIWGYIRENNMPYCCLYDEGFKRIGCIGCPAAGTEGRKIEFARWPKFERAYKLAISKILKPNQTVEQYFYWWIENVRKEEEPEGCWLFE